MEFVPYKLGEKKVPVATYVLGPNREQDCDNYPESESELCENVYYLGKRGVYTESKGVKIAYLSGIGSTEKNEQWTYGEKEVKDLCDLSLIGDPSFRGVDILLTSEWPSGVADKNINSTLKYANDYPSYLCLKLRPRYAISGLEGVYYEKPPFRVRNLSSNDSSMEIVTRFLGLARVGNPNKDKWLYALSLTPLDKMKISELLEKTTDEVPCPFDLAELETKLFKGVKRKTTGQDQYFYDMDAPMDDEGKQNRSKKQKMEFDQSKCWFCLASPSVEKHLVITVGETCYLSLAKGGMVDEHLLICPMEHFQNSLCCSEDILREMGEFKKALRKFYERKNEVPIFFERNFKTSHMQLQVIPIPEKATRELKDIFVEESELRGFKLQVLDIEGRLDQVIPPKKPYFTVELPDGTVLFALIHSSMYFPLSFGREVLGSGPVLNLPNRVEYKDCILEQKKEEKLVERIRNDFEPYDFTNK